MEKIIKKKQSYIITQPGEKKLRLDVYLSGQLEGYSRSAALNLISQGHVLVNGQAACKGGLALKQGDCVEVSLPAGDYSLAESNKPQKIDLSIIDEQEDFLIIHKPAGLLVHCASTNKDEASLVSGLLYHYYHDFNKFDDEVRPGIVHRLDKNTSGLVIVAKNPQSQRDFSNQFKDRLMQKTYLALVEGHPEKEGVVSYPVGRHPVKRHMMSHKGINARDAKTDYTVLAYYDSASLVAFKPLTGRTHQIRVHAASIGHAIMGDEVYGKRSKYIDRQALHAWKLAFTYKGKEYSYTAPLPNDMTQAIALLEQKNINLLHDEA